MKKHLVNAFENDVKAEATKPSVPQAARSSGFENDVKAEATNHDSVTIESSDCLRMMQKQKVPN